MFLISLKYNQFYSFLDAKEGCYNPKMSPDIPKGKWRKAPQWIAFGNTRRLSLMMILYFRCSRAVRDRRTATTCFGFGLCAEDRVFRPIPQRAYADLKEKWQFLVHLQHFKMLSSPQS
ncbi:hypothetical protein C5167_030636 [Papaver somniferum]|nr:hypothetical protein C5167_030636 [Papaver somniferum]